MARLTIALAAIAAIAATAVAACAAASPGGTRASVTVSVAPERGHPGRWCATVVDSRARDERQTLCQTPRGRPRTEAVLAVDCPTHRVVLLGIAPRRLQAVRLVGGGPSKSATLEHREHVTAFAVASTLSDFPAQLRTSTASHRRARALRNPRSLCHAQRHATALIDAFNGS